MILLFYSTSVLAQFVRYVELVLKTFDLVVCVFVFYFSSAVITGAFYCTLSLIYIGTVISLIYCSS